MSLIWTSRARTKQPQGESGLSLGNPIARGLKFIETGYGRDIKDGRLPVAGTATKTVGPPGRGLTFNGSSDYQRYVNPTGFTVPLSLFIVFTVSSVPNSTVFGLFSSTSDTNGIVALRTVAGSIAVYTYEPTTGYVESAYTAGVPTGVVLTAGASVSAAGGKTAYLAGVPTATTTHAISLSASDRLSIGKIDRASPGDYFPGTIFLAAAWDRVLSAAEFAELNRNPWQLFAPEQSPRFFSFANVLFSKLDETTASNTDYITTSTAGSVAEMQLGSVTDPGVDTLHSIKLRASGSGSLQVDLVQGSGALLTIWTPEAVDKTKRSGLVLSRQNILTRGLIAGIVGGHPFDVVRGDGLVNSGAERVASQNGIAWSLASGEYLDSGNSGISVAPGAKWSAMVLVRSTSSTYSGQYAVCVNYNGSSVALALTLGTSAAATGAAIFDGGYWRSSGVATPVYGDGRYHVILGVRNGPDLHYYVDGRLDSSYTMPPEASPGTSTTAITWGQYKNDGTNTTMVGELALGFVWSGVALTASDAKSLASDPWQLFAPERRPRHIPAAKPIASRTIPLIATPTDYRRELLPAEAALITDYTDLRVRLRGV